MPGVVQGHLDVRRDVGDLAPFNVDDVFHHLLDVFQSVGGSSAFCLCHLDEIHL